MKKERMPFERNYTKEEFFFIKDLLKTYEDTLGDEEDSVTEMLQSIRFAMEMMREVKADPFANVNSLQRVNFYAGCLIMQYKTTFRLQKNACVMFNLQKEAVKRLQPDVFAFYILKTYGGAPLLKDVEPYLPLIATNEYQMLCQLSNLRNKSFGYMQSLTIELSALMKYAADKKWITVKEEKANLMEQIAKIDNIIGRLPETEMTLANYGEKFITAYCQEEKHE